MSKIVATIEARMNSTRLPGKVLLLANSKPMLGHLVNRIRQVNSLDDIVIATTINQADQPICEFADKNKILCFRGSENDVMQRVVDTAEFANAEIIVEITGDCPIIDPLLIEQTIQIFLHNNCDYASNANIRSYPDGMDVSVFYLSTLKRSAEMTSDSLDHEHVTLHIRNHPELFRLVNLIAPPDLHWPNLGLTLDEYRDYELLKKIIEYFGDDNPYFTCKEVVELLKKNVEWIRINQDVERKGAT